MTKCYGCRRVIREKDRRDIYRAVTWSGPSYIDQDGGCVHCCPTSDEVDEAEDAMWERRIGEAREA
jgi:hypothetical protein